VVRRLAERLCLAVEQVADLAKQIQELTKPRFSPLAELYGVSLLTAGALAGILGPGNRFASEAQLAAYAGAAPLEASSAGSVRHRLNRHGNRRLNAILYRIVLIQARGFPEAKAYLTRRTSQGKTIVREGYKHTDTRTRDTATRNCPRAPAMVASGVCTRWGYRVRRDSL
jgi:transposase